MTDEGLIELTESIQVNDSLTLTHVSICNITIEESRPWANKLGYFDIWLAYGYLRSDGHMVEPEYNGLNIIISEKDELSEFNELYNKVTTLKSIMLDVKLIIGQFLIDKGYIVGNLIME
ncbi:MAG: hypothetical protein ACTSRA_00345 [Promethearchaeota archaeon]|nr:MAG: hypothetical protein [Helarchaeota virus Nidhogg Meg22_1012]URC17404.1 MAG: hypothetical protein [Helarchaeota virus Nidhogg Meg22_1214]